MAEKLTTKEIEELNPIWIVPEDTVRTYFDLKYRPKLLQKVEQPYADSFGVDQIAPREYVHKALLEMLAPRARIAYDQIGSTNTIRLAVNNMRETIVASLPKRV